MMGKACRRVRRVSMMGKGRRCEGAQFSRLTEKFVVVLKIIQLNNPVRNGFIRTNKNLKENINRAGKRKRAKN